MDVITEDRLRRAIALSGVAVSTDPLSSEQVSRTGVTCRIVFREGTVFEFEVTEIEMPSGTDGTVRLQPGQVRITEPMRCCGR